MQSSSQIITTNKPTSGFLQALPVAQPTVSSTEGKNVVLRRISKNVHYIVFYNLKKPEPVFIIFGAQYPDNPLLKGFVI